MDYYEILGLDKNATDSQIKKAYYKLARENHPDKVGDKDREEATKKFQQIGEAYEVLSNEEKRKQYDMFGKEGLNGNEGGADPFDIFSQMFGQGFSGGFGQTNFQGFGQSFGQQSKRKNKETVFPLNITLTQVYTGITKKLKVSRKAIFKGSEKVDVKDYESTWEKCSKCNGHGIFIRKQQIGPNMFSQSQFSCEFCFGKGNTLLPEYKLDDISEIIHVDVPKGVPNGHQLLFPDMGNAGPGCLPGDLIVVLQCNNQENGFIRQGNDLLYRKKISLVDALCGVSFDITTLDDRKLKIAYSDIIIPGEKRVIKNEGIRGNLILEFEIIFPTSVKNKDKLRKMLSKG